MAAAYAVNSYPDDATLARYGSEGPYDGSTRLGALKNVGYQQAMFNLARCRRPGCSRRSIWLDVEPVPIFEWSADQEANAAVVEGAARGYTDAGFQIGAYSTPVLWETVVGDFTLGGIPEWRAAGADLPGGGAQPVRAGLVASRAATGVIGQWVEDNRDRNITCPGAVPADVPLVRPVLIAAPDAAARQASSASKTD